MKVSQYELNLDSFPAGNLNLAKLIKIYNLHPVKFAYFTHLLMLVSSKDV